MGTNKEAVSGKFYFQCAGSTQESRIEGRYQDKNWKITSGKAECKGCGAALTLGAPNRSKKVLVTWYCEKEKKDDVQLIQLQNWSVG